MSIAATARTRAHDSIYAIIAIAVATLTAIMLGAAMPHAAYAGDTVKGAQCDLTGLSAPKLNATAASTGIHDMTMTLTFDCASASSGTSTIVYSNAPGSENAITVSSLMWLDTDDGAMADDATFAKAGTYTLLVTATMPENALDWDDSAALPVSLDGVAIGDAEVTHNKGTSVYKLTMYLPFEVKGTPSIGSGDPTTESPKTGVEGTAPLLLCTAVSLLGAACAGSLLLRMRRKSVYSR